MKEKDEITFYFGNQKKHSSKSTFSIIVILGIIAIFVTFSRASLRYQTGQVLGAVIATFGSFCNLGGYVLIGFFFISLLMKRFNVKTLVLAVLLLWIGSFLTGTPFTLFSYNFGESRPPIGYH